MTTLTRDEIIVCLQKLNVIGITIYQLEGIRQACEMIMRVPEWVSVEERLPDNNLDDVWVSGNADGTRYWAASGLAFNDNAWLEKYHVTHWMPLPKAPT